MLKKSKYNLIVDTLDNGNKLFFNTMTSVFGIMDPDTELLYNNIEQINVDKITDKKTIENIENLKIGGYIIQENYNEFNDIKFLTNMKRFNTSTLSLVIAPTMDCNMACPYCYEKENRKKSYMDSDIQEKIVAFVKNFTAQYRCKSFHVTWYGGEPTMALPIIKSLSKKFIDICDENNIKYTSSMISNGVLLTRETAVTLKECKVYKVQITIDGLPEFHNKRRILISGEPSFEIITENIEKCKDLLNLTVRVNIDKNNINGLDDIMRYFLYEKKWDSNPSFYLGHVIDYTDYHGDDTFCFLSEQFGEIDARYSKTLYDYNKDLGIRTIYPIRINNYCSATCINNYVIDPDGNLHKCWNTIGQERECIGNINEKFTANTSFTKWTLHELKETCKECVFLPICGGGCPYQDIINGKTVCTYTTFNYKEKLKIAYEDHLAKKSL